MNIDWANVLVSLSVMWILKKTDKFSVIGVSVAGGIMHNVGQIIMAVILLGTEQIALYLPVLIITGTATGIVIGIVAGLVINRFKNIRI